MSELRRYLLAVTAAALAVSLARAVPQNKSIGRMADLFGGLLVLIVFLRPILSLRIGDLRYFSGFRPDEALIDEAISEGEKESARLITEQTRTYILDKAQALGCEVEAQIELAELSEHYCYPYRVTLRGRWSAQQQQSLSEYLFQTLGIPEERQIWQEE